jgi:serine/threonine protein kinase
MSLSAGTRLGPYEVLGLIGAGGMGEVYKARDTRLDRRSRSKSSRLMSAAIRNAGPGLSARRRRLPV